jgi:hypothetical protein
MPSVFEADEPHFEPVPCPNCGESLKIIPIVYGYPTPETFEAEARGELVIAGCMVSDANPRYACAACREPLPPSALMADRAQFEPVPPDEAERSIRAFIERYSADDRL